MNEIVEKCIEIMKNHKYKFNPRYDRSITDNITDFIYEVEKRLKEEFQIKD